MLTATLSVATALGTELHTRDQADQLFSALQNQWPCCSTFILDLADVSYMSRSFADQFHKLKMAWASKDGIQFEIHNASQQVLDILRAVATTQRVHMRKADDTIPVYSYSSQQQLMRLLQGM